jgi:hypothetical protein
VVAKAREKKTHTACLLGEQIDDDITAAKSELELMEAQEIGDDLECKAQQIATVTEIANTQPEGVGTADVRTIRAAIETNKYWPHGGSPSATLASRTSKNAPPSSQR